MTNKLTNLLYTYPEYYELLYPDMNESIPSMCKNMFSKYLNKSPNTILDMGCGTARDLNVLARAIPNCYGIDCLPNVIEYAKKIRSHLKLSVGNMTNTRLGMTFDSILCLGSAFMYALSNKEIDEALTTFAVHSKLGTLLIIGIINGAGFLNGKNFKETIEHEVVLPIGKAKSIAQHSIDYRKQIMIRKRKWIVNDEEMYDDYCEYRLLFPMEIEHRLELHRFKVLDYYDNKNLVPTDLSGTALYIVAQYI